MLSIASASVAFNPVHAVVTKVSEIGIVGFDKRALASSVADLSPKAALEKIISRAAQNVVMQATPDVPNAPQPKLIGDYGFDPLSLGKEENFAYMREAEIKHGRLAMLAAIAWPVQEIVNPIATDVLSSNGVNVKDVLVESGGASPSLLNGGLFQNEVFPALLLFTVGASILEEGDVNDRKAMGFGINEYAKSYSGGFGRTPGNFGFDPLNLYRPLTAADKASAQERELMNGRFAMLAVGSYVATEFFGQTTVVRATPALFEPLIFQPWFRSFMDSSFGVASMDGSIDGVAY
eukprot:CAMPEP_0115872332 /NCGR_PEP_ID=MMETSP0287-20121206/23363_1 /TAXON_ID=412157 /ORGANISM="Chrysochromulina rotalis, Strain UIO044" /LENGTH=291 /DNA_ID=CAMNT_0003327233 /DNA_START=20 /DNA_END=895 /DNA_ORIENTATION=-